MRGPSEGIRLDGLSKRFGDVTALNEVSLDVRAGEIAVLLGPSGSGKSTVLNLCAGIQVPSSGRIFFGDRDITDLATAKRDVGFVFQSYALFPHLTVRENVAFSLRTERHRLPNSAIRSRVDELLDLIGLSTAEHRYPRELSGGEQQRVAIGRALAFRPRVLLFDEPLGALDPHLKGQLLADILRLRATLDVTVLYVTHDQEEALRIADRIAVLRAGSVEQFDTPRNIYEEPATEFVASFIGEANVLRGSVVDLDDDTAVIKTSYGVLRSAGRQRVTRNTRVAVFVSPEEIEVHAADHHRHACNSIAGTLRRVSFGGSHSRFEVDIGDGTIWTAKCSPQRLSCELAPETKVVLSWTQSATRVVSTESVTQAAQHQREHEALPSTWSARTCVQ